LLARRDGLVELTQLSWSVIGSTGSKPLVFLNFIAVREVPHAVRGVDLREIQLEELVSYKVYREEREELRVASASKS